jgi:hypothetical protein
VTLVVGKWFMWWGGHSWGPRLLADVTPLLCFFLYPVRRHLVRSVPLRLVFVAVVAFSIGSHALGAFLYDGRWDRLADVDNHPQKLWSWAEGPLAFYARQGASAIRDRLSLAPTGPTSADSPTLLSATLEAATSEPAVFTREVFDVSVEVTNTGRALWLAHTADERGMVQVGWRWFADRRETPTAGWEALPANVDRGQSVQIDVRIMAPEAAGDYELVLDLVSHWVTWFADRGTVPLRIPIRVRPLDAATLLREPIAADGKAPQAKIATDRTSYGRGDAIELSVDLWNPQRPARFDGYLILAAPDGSAMFYDGHEDVGVTSGTTVPWARALPLPARVSGRFSVSLSRLQPGDYEWHLLLVGTNGRGVVTRAATSFHLAP